MLHVQESVNLTIYLYVQTMGQQRMLYIRKFYVVKNIECAIYVNEGVSRNYQSNAKPGLLLKEKVKKEGVPRNQKNSRETGLRLKNAKPLKDKLQTGTQMTTDTEGT